MVRFLHTADWQIGMKLTGFGAMGERIRGERLSAAERALRMAQENRTDFILITGDLFEDNSVDRALIQKVVDILKRAHCPVFIIPGNHDPLVPGSVWEDRSWQAAENVVVFRENAPYPLPGAVLYPCPLAEKQSAKDPTAWIHAEDEERIAIGLAHGSVEGAPIGEWDHPIPRDAAARSGLDYLALGHWHSFAVFGAEGSAGRMAYPGTHEATSFGERDSGNVSLVEIDGRGAAPSVTPVRTGALSWVTVDERISRSDDLQSILSRIREMENAESTLLKLQLSGFITPEGRERLDDIERVVASRFFWGATDFGGLTPAPEDDSWIEELPPGVLREVGKRLRTESVDSRVRTKALLELYSLIKEARA